MNNLDTLNCETERQVLRTITLNRTAKVEQENEMLRNEVDRLKKYELKTTVAIGNDFSYWMKLADRDKFLVQCKVKNDMMCIEFSVMVTKNIDNTYNAGARDTCCYPFEPSLNLTIFKPLVEKAIQIIGKHMEEAGYKFCYN